MAKKKESFFSLLFSGKNKGNPVLEEVVEDHQLPTTSETLPSTVLVLTPEQESVLNPGQIADLRQKLLALPPVPIGEINIAPFEAGLIQGGYYVKVFIRNAKDLLDEVGVEKLPLSLVDASGDVVARGVFRLQNFGALKFGESRYWVFAWRPEEVLKANADLSFFALSFQ